MSEHRSTLERELERLSPPRIPFDQLERRRDRKRRDQRIRAGVVGLALAIAMAWLGVNVIRSGDSVPANETPSPTPSPTEDSAPAVNIDWERVPGPSIDGDAIVDVRTGQVTPLPASITSLRNPGGYAVAPGGDVLLFEADAGGSSDSQIFVANVDGSNVRQLTDAPGGAAAGGWSPDGTTIVANVGGGGGRHDIDLVLIDVATGETTVLTSESDKEFHSPHFSSDGQLILISRFQKYRELEAPYPEDQGSDVYGMPVEGGDAALVFEDRWNATFSPDGRTIVYEQMVVVLVYEQTVVVENGGGSEVWLADADGSNPRPLVPNDEWFGDTPSWSPDGTRIVYSKHPHDLDSLVAVVDVASGTPTFSVLAPGSPGSPVAVWLDDNTLLIDV